MPRTGRTARIFASMSLAGLLGLTQAHEVEALVNTAEQALASGHTAAAIASFERAAATQHAAGIEMGLVRASMQAGAYREALAFCAHTAGGHLDSPGAGALYAWLLRVGGQEDFANRVLSDTLARMPDDAVAQATRRAFDAGVLKPSGVLLELPHRMAPLVQMQGGQALPSPGARAVSAGVLVDAGRRAIVPLAGLESARDSALNGVRKLWVRNGLGHMSEAVLDSAAEASGPLDALHALGLTRLRLVTPLEPGATVFAPTDPFAGSPGFAVDYPASIDATPLWPTLHEGFLGAFTGREGWRRIGIELPSGRHGGPVLDAAGRLAGIALQGGTEAASMLPVSMWRDLVSEAPIALIAPIAPASAGPAISVRMSADEAYERGLRLALQVLVLP